MLHVLKKRNPDFIFISDTRLSKNVESVVRDEWDGRCLFSSFSSQARGVAIFIRKGNPARIIDSFADGEGNLLAILLSYENKRILIEALYGPNEDNPDFYSETAFKKIEEWMPDCSIFAGDWNIALNQDKDTKNYLHSNNQRATEALKERMEQYNLIDIWRHLNPEGRTYTWRKFNTNKQSRLDYFLISSSLMPYVQSAGIYPGVWSDHSLIELEKDFSSFTRGKGFWKFNASLIYEPAYRDLVKKTIKSHQDK